jgi:hypothetical protein
VNEWGRFIAVTIMGAAVVLTVSSFASFRQSYGDEEIAQLKR